MLPVRLHARYASIPRGMLPPPVLARVRKAPSTGQKTRNRHGKDFSDPRMGFFSSFSGMFSFWPRACPRFLVVVAAARICASHTFNGRRFFSETCRCTANRSFDNLVQQVQESPVMTVNVDEGVSGSRYFAIRVHFLDRTCCPASSVWQMRHMASKTHDVLCQQAGRVAECVLCHLVFQKCVTLRDCASAQVLLSLTKVCAWPWLEQARCDGAAGGFHCGRCQCERSA